MGEKLDFTEDEIAALIGRADVGDKAAKAALLRFNGQCLAEIAGLRWSDEVGDWVEAKPPAIEA